jgi:D-tyrosyl-tRNA(Tyr) deacylase
VSQFTLFANTKKGAKPDFHAAAKGEAAKSLYDTVLGKVAKGMPNGKEDIADGVFGAMMDVSLINDGPVTITLDTEKKE